MGIKIPSYIYHIFPWTILTVLNFAFLPERILEQHGSMQVAASGFFHLFMWLFVFYSTYSFIVPRTLIRKKKYLQYVLLCLALIILSGSPFILTDIWVLPGLDELDKD